MSPGRVKVVTSPLAPIVGLPMNVVPFAASKNSPVCSDWLIARRRSSSPSCPGKAACRFDPDGLKEVDVIRDPDDQDVAVRPAPDRLTLPDRLGTWSPSVRRSPCSA